MIRALIHRTLGWLLPAAPEARPPAPMPCAACGRPVNAWRNPKVGELVIGGTCSEDCAFDVLERAAQPSVSRL